MHDDSNFTTRGQHYKDLDPVYTVTDSCGHEIEFGKFAVIFTLTIFSIISCD